MKRGALALAGALLLAGCPIPQAVPDYPAGTITPPRILMDEISGAGQRIIYVPADCAGAHPTYPLSAKLVDVNTLELVRVRWFVNYDANIPARSMWAHQDDIQGSTDTQAPTQRIVPTWTFDAYGGYGTATDPQYGVASANGALQIVDLVVSNSFDDGATALPNRTPTAGFETQAYRWIFVTKPADGTLTCPP